MEQIYIVTGANGHLGKTIVQKLVQMKKNVRALVLPFENTDYLKNLGVKVYFGNVTNKKSLLPIFTARKKELYVIHCAGIVSVKSGKNKKVYDVNVNGTKNVADLCLEKKVKKLIHVSSVHAITEKEHNEIITDPEYFNADEVIGTYAKTKAEASKYILGLVKKGLPAVIVHPSGIVGPNDLGTGHLTHMIIDYLDGMLSACVKGGYDFVDVRDVADGVISALEKGRIGECYILSNKYYSVKELLNTISSVTGKKPIKRVLPMWFAKVTAPLAEVFYKIIRRPPLYTSYSLYTLTSNAFFSHKKADKELGYKNRSLEETIRDTVMFLRDKKVVAY